MAVFALEWKAAGPRPMPSYASFGGELTVKEAASQAHKKGYPLSVDLSGSATTVLELKKGEANEVPLWLASIDGANTAAAAALASMPLQVRPGDIFSASLSTAGAATATTVDHIGDLCGWIASTVSGETEKAVFDLSGTVYFIIVGFDDRDAVGTSGGRMLAMYVGPATPADVSQA